MPINDHAGAYTEKLSKPTAAATSATATTTATITNASADNLKYNSQLSLQMLLNSNSNSTKTSDNTLVKHQGQKWQQIFDFDKMLKQIRISEKQHLRDKFGESSSSGSNGKGSSSHNNTTSPSKTSLSSSASAAALLTSAASSATSAVDYSAHQIKQVQRLNGTDMRYYGIVPKQTALEVVVCNVCMGIYTKVGFNNHMMLQHPSAWSSISTKLTTMSTKDSANYSTQANDNSQDSVREATSTAAADVVPSPSDLSATMSTCSNASSSSSSLSSTAAYHANASRHKSSKNGSSLAGSSSGGSSSSSGGRSRSKSKHHSSSTSSSHAATTSSATETPQTSLNKSSKKLSNNISINAVNSSSAVPLHGTSSKETKQHASSVTNETAQSITVFSSSSNSSCSLPTTPKMSNTSIPEAAHESTFSPANLINISEAKDKSSIDSTTSTAVASIIAAKKKDKSPAFIGAESIDSSTSNSSSEYERIGVNGVYNKSVSNPAAAAASYINATKMSNKNNSSSTTTKSLSEKELNRFNSQLSELDQAVSSITGITADSKTNDTLNVACLDSMEPNLPTTANTTAATIAFKIQPNTHTGEANSGIMPVATTAQATISNYATTETLQTGNADDAMAHNTSDDNSILTLADMLDSNIINEILNTAETDIHFDENELDATSQQNYLQQQAQPQLSAKRMRYDDAAVVNQLQQQQQQQQHHNHHQQHATEMTENYAVFQQQQQQILQQHQHQQQQQQFAHYDMVDADMKIYNTAEHQGIDAQQQYHTQLNKVLLQTQEPHQITAIDAIQLQQLLYQQQNTYNTTAGSMDETTAMQQQQQQYDHQTGQLVNAKQIIDLCADQTGMQKPTTAQKGLALSELDGTVACGSDNGKLTEYATLTSINNVYEENSCEAMAAQFQIYNIASLTDDEPAPAMQEDHDVLMPAMVDNVRTAAQQYVLPSTDLIYEITANNQVSIMSQQRQQQVITEFLTQAGYTQTMDNQLNANNGTTTLTTSTTNAVGSNNLGDAMTWDESNDLFDLDCSLMETVKSISSDQKYIKTEPTTAGSTTTTTAIAAAAGSMNKYHEDFYCNVFIYSGIPRPLTLNSFGLVKLPQAVATTFRKHLLSTRKANNNPIMLSGCINGMVGANSASSTGARFTNIGAKSMQNYFTTLSSSGSSTGNANEFSIGSITITNSPTLAQHQSSAAYALQKQQNAATGPIEISFNAATNGLSAASPGGLQRGGRSKVNANNLMSTAGPTTSASNGSLTKGKTALINTTMSAVTAAAAGTVVRNNAKTILINNTTTTNANIERAKFVKRTLIAKIDANASAASNMKKSNQISSKQIAEILGFAAVNKSAVRHQQQQQQQQTQPLNTVDNNCRLERDSNTNEEHVKQNRTNGFYERRKKLISNLASISRVRHTPQQQHLKQKLLKQQLLRTLSDCGINSIAALCKSNNQNSNNHNNSSSNNNKNNNNNSNSSDIVRVFV